METKNEDTPKYVVLEKSLIGNDLHEAGATVTYDGLPAENLEPTCDEGRRRRQLYIESNADRVAKMKEQYSESAVGDPTQFAAKFAAELQRSNQEFMASIPGMIGAAVAQAMAAAFPNGTGAAPAATKPAAKGKTGDGEGLV